MPERINLEKQKFGKLTVLFCTNLKDNDNRLLWKCQCDCGNETNIAGKRLRDGRTKSCGCINKARGKDSIVWQGYGEISKTYFNQAKLGAYKRDFPFEISIEDMHNQFLKQNRKCALSGLELTFSSLAHSGDGNASLDRINSQKGYTKDNIQWVDKDVNRMKQHFPEDKFIKLCKLIAQHNV